MANKVKPTRIERRAVGSKSKEITKSCAKPKHVTTTREMVVRLDERLDAIMEQFKKHCNRSWAVELAFITAGIGFIVQVIWKVLNK